MKVRIGLRARLVMVVMLAILPLLGLFLLKAWVIGDTTIQRVTENLRFSAALVAANHQRVGESAHQILIAVAKTPGLISGNRDDCGRYLTSLNEQLSMYTNLGIIGPDGHFICDGVGSSSSIFVGDLEFFKSAVAKRNLSFSGYMVARATGKAALNIGMPIEENGAVTAVAVASIDLAEFSRSMASVPLPTGSRFLITDRTGIVLATSPDPSAVVGQPVGIPLLQEAITYMRAGSAEGQDGEGKSRLYSFLPVRLGPDALFFVAVSADRDLAVGPARHELFLELLVLGLVAFLGSWLAWMMGSRAIVEPTNEILGASRKIEQGIFDERISASLLEGDGEFSQMAGAFNQMADSLQKQRDALKAELARSENAQKKLEDAQRLGRIGYWQLDTETSQSWWSDEVYDVLGVDRTGFDGTIPGLIRLIHPDDQERFKAARAVAVEGGLPFDTEVRVVTGKGEVRWVHFFGRVNDQGDHTGSTRRSGVVQEITQRKRAEQTVARNTELLNRTGEMAKIGGWELLLDRMALVCSDEVYRIHGVDFRGRSTALEQAIGFYAPEAQPIARAAIMAGIEHGQSWDLVLPFVTAKGRRIQVRLQGQAIQEDGKTVRLVGVFQDVTEQHAAQAHLKLLEAAVSRLNDIVLITEAEPIEEPGPRIVFVNDAFERRTGYSREEVIGKSPRLLQGPLTQRSELDRISAALRKWQPVRAELINYTKSGDPFWLELDIVPIADEKGWFTHMVSVERDISQRKLAEQALVDSEQRYAALFASAPVPMWIVDDKTLRFLAVNETALSNYGYSREEFLQMSSYDIRPPEERERLRQNVSNPVVGGANRWIHLRKDGVEIPTEVVARMITYMGTVARFVVAMDITPQIKAEKAAQDYLFTLQRAADATQAIAAHQTLEGAMQEVAEQARGVIGAHQAVVSVKRGADWSQALNVQSLSEKYAGFRGLVSQWDGSGIYSVVCDANRPMRLSEQELLAHPRWSSLASPNDKHPPMRGWLAVPLTGHSGENIGLLQLTDKYEGDFSIEDQYVTAELAQLASIAFENASLFEQVRELNAGLEEKVAERTAALTRQEAMARALADQAPQIIWHADTAGRLTYVNQHWYDLMGGTRDDWQGNNWTAAVHPDDLPDVMTNWQASAKSLAPYVGMRRFLTRDGTYHTMSYRAAPVLGEDGKAMFWVGIDADVSEIKAIETALRMSNQELEAFSYSVSHDLRSPLNTVDGFSRLLAKQLDASGPNDKVRHYLTRIQAGVAQMGRLIEDLLSLAQVSRMQMRQETVDISFLAREIVDECRGREPERQADIHIDDGLLALGDGRLIRVVMENLLGNAWKFTSQKSRAEIRVGYKADSTGTSAFYVQDNGAGFDMTYADKLFNTFQRLHAVTEFPGTGVGLATVSRVIGRHRGQVWAEAEPGKGATFFFTLPAIVNASDMPKGGN
ncbi:MAG TPA: PAS domain S-box protein [Polaromonas sp.]|uniref:PAS domain S-box protein n=1 Tax=Polaromonas sp. TaxID=1869339 RepID=UPI002D24BC5E|nr:PAS domain S-box protein [Polaromonas sp.]HYW56256.1 PAS domain S-box protein [Polaromonas sp.]